MAESESTLNKCVVTEARKNKFSPMEEQQLNDKDVASIWNSLSEFIEKNMSELKGVQVPGLGVFSFTQKKTDIGNNKHLLLQRPVFLLSEKFAQLHGGLTYPKYFIPGHIPLVRVNYAALSCSTPYDRDAVESCIREVLLALNRSVAAKQNIEFTFAGIGRLQIREGKAKMKFYRSFINSMDGSGALIESMQNRQGTVDSVISEGQGTSRGVTPNTLLLPKMCKIKGSLSDRAPLPDIAEDNADNLGDLVDLNMNLNQQAEEYLEKTDGVEETDRQSVVEQRRELAPIATVTGISFDDDLPTPSTPAKSRPLSQSCPGPLMNLQPIDAISPTPSDELKPPSPPADLRPVERVRIRSGTKSACGHHNSGQELCYLCHQRERVNIPVSFAEERARREMEEDRLMQQFNQFKDAEFSLKYDAESLSRKHENQKTAAFNLGVSEATKMKKHSRSTDFYPSYVFQSRPYTPPRYIKQSELDEELGKQCSSKKLRTEAQRADEQFLERLEQVQLAEDLAAQREKFLGDKYDRQEDYKRALSAQLRTKPCPLPAYVPDSAEPFFGKNDSTEEKLMERRRIAHDLFREQVDLSAKKKRDAILRRVAAQKDEENVLQKTKDELLCDQVSRYDRMLKLRHHLEDNWAGATKTKVGRDRELFQRSLTPGILLHEQCDRYKKCRHCKKTLRNCGESNVWCDTRYIAGSRIMV